MKQTIKIVFALVALGVFLTAALFLVNKKDLERSKGQRDVSKAKSGPQKSVPDLSKNNQENATLLSKDIQGEWLEIDDPTTDGWETEAFTIDAEKQLKYLSQFLTSSDSANRTQLKKIAASNFTGTPLLPDNLQLVIESPSITVHRKTQKDTMELQKG